ncbi:MAG: cation transporter [Tenericutes bacterium HGW-Tenericutes-1]|nr:MAG: cation transporter [Tenericutes bacterium HGW-Tenericutes-1]
MSFYCKIMDGRRDTLSKNSSENRLRTAFLLNFGFSIIEVIGGLFTNSIALLSDAVHDIGDSISLGLSWFLNEKSKKKPDTLYTYGYARYSLLGGLVSALVLIAGSIFLIIEAIPRIMNPETIKVPWLIGFAILGILINGIAALKTSKGHSLNEKMVSLHLFEDVAGWVALFISSIIMFFWDVPVLDPILSIIFTLYILTHVYKNIKAIFEIFLEKSPKGIDVLTILSILKTNSNIKEVHHVHTWTLEGNLIFMTLHVVMKSDLDKVQIVEEQKWIHHILSENGIHHATIELECDELCLSPDCDPINQVKDNHHHGHHH